MLVIFAADHPNAPFFFNIPAWVIATIFVGIDVLRYLGDRLWGTLLLELLRADRPRWSSSASSASSTSCRSSPGSWAPRRHSAASGRRAGGPRLGRAKPRRQQTRDFDRVVAGPWTGPVTGRSERDGPPARQDELGRPERGRAQAADRAGQAPARRQLIRCGVVATVLRSCCDVADGG